MSATLLTSRALLRLSPLDESEDVAAFLQGLVTNDTSGDLPVWAALLSAQGKALFDFLIWGDGDDILIDCDVSDMDRLDAAFDALKTRWDHLDFVVHAIGFSDKNELRGKYLDTSLENFLMTMNISAYSLVAVARRAAAMMPPLAEDGRGGGSILTLSYYGAEKVIPHYNVMGVAKAALETSVKYLANDLGPDGIRVNAISAGPIEILLGDAFTLDDQTLAGIAGLYDRAALIAQDTTPCIPPRKNRKKQRRYSKTLYKQRHTIESMCGRIKDWRRIAM